MRREDITALLASWGGATDRRGAATPADLHAEDSVMESGSAY